MLRLTRARALTVCFATLSAGSSFGACGGEREPPATPAPIAPAPAPVVSGDTASATGAPTPPQGTGGPGQSLPPAALDAGKPLDPVAMDASGPGAANPPPSNPVSAAVDAGSAQSPNATPDAGSAPDPFPNGQQAGGAVATAYAALTRGDVAAMTRALDDLDALTAREPNNGYAHFYASTFRLWQLSEAQGLNGVLGIATMLAGFDRAREILPSDFRVPGFYGLAQVNTLDVGGGMETLQDSIDMFPAYGYFLRATATSVLDRTDPRFATTVSDMEALVQACRYPLGTGDVAYRYPASDMENDRVARVCLDKGIVPHVWEGVFVSFGDMVLKAGGDAARARSLYRSAQTSPTYDSWPFARLLEQRIASADERRAQYADANPLNDPPVWAVAGQICRGCHQQR